MYYKNIYFHNVSSMPKTPDGYYRLSRLPSNIDYNENSTAYLTAGVELRFKIKGDEAIVTLFVEGEVNGKAELYYGSFTTDVSYALHQGVNVITIKNPNTVSAFFEREQSYYAPFSSNVVRLLLPKAFISFVNVEGEVELPLTSEMPKSTILFYGSNLLSNDDYSPSITATS